MFGRNLFSNNKQYIRRNFVVRKNSPTNFDNFSHVSPLSTGMGKHNSIIIMVFIFANTSYLFQLCETVVAMFALSLNPQWSKQKVVSLTLFPQHFPPIAVLFEGTATCYENLLTTGTNR